MSWTPCDYLHQYVPEEVYEKMAYAMSRTHVEQTGRSLNVSAGELKTFFGISLAMSCLAYPQIQMYWKKKTRVPLIANSMARNRYLKLRRRLQIVNKLDISDDEKKEDLLWCIRPLVSCLLEGCRKIPRPEHVCIAQRK